MSCVNNGQLSVVGPSAIQFASGAAPPVTFFLQLAGTNGYILLADGSSHIVLAGH